MGRVCLGDTHGQGLFRLACELELWTQCALLQWGQLRIMGQFQGQRAHTVPRFASFGLWLWVGQLQGHGADTVSSVPQAH